jgi:hypothetical protein
MGKRGAEVKGLLAWLAITFAAAGIGAMASSGAEGFYAQLAKPAWAPPASVFGPMWTLLRVADQGNRDRTAHAGAVRRAAGGQRHLELAILRAALRCCRLRRCGTAVCAGSCDNLGILARAFAGRHADAALPGVGGFCMRAHVEHVAHESWIAGIGARQTPAVFSPPRVGGDTLLNYGDRPVA